jgi:hypothetical protein
MFWCAHAHRGNLFPADVDRHPSRTTPGLPWPPVSFAGPAATYRASGQKPVTYWYRFRPDFQVAYLPMVFPDFSLAPICAVLLGFYGDTLCL